MGGLSSMIVNVAIGAIASLAMLNLCFTTPVLQDKVIHQRSNYCSNLLSHSFPQQGGGIHWQQNECLNPDVMRELAAHVCRGNTGSTNSGMPPEA
jgi:hypothetical protein